MNTDAEVTNRRQFDALRRLLMSLQAEVSAAMAAARAAIADDGAENAGITDLKDVAEKAQRGAVYEATIARTVRELQDVEDALTRLQEGTYGACTACGERIANARLEVNPAARLCVQCQSLQEQHA